MASSSVNVTVSNHLVGQVYYLEQTVKNVRTYKANFCREERSIAALPLTERRVSLLGPASQDPRDPPQQILIHLNELTAEEKAARMIQLWYCKEPLLKTKHAKPLPEGFPSSWDGSPVGLDPRFGYLKF